MIRETIAAPPGLAPLRPMRDGCAARWTQGSGRTAAAAPWRTAARGPAPGTPMIGPLCFDFGQDPPPGPGTPAMSRPDPGVGDPSPTSAVPVRALPQPTPD